MARRFVLRCATVVVLAVALVGHAGAPVSFADASAPRSQIRIGLAQPNTLDPARPITFSAAEVISHLFVGLAEQGPDGTYEPMVAKSWDVSEDGRTYTFHLRDDWTWSDGTPLTAHDFMYAWQATSGVQPAGPGGGFLVPLHPIQNARAIDAGELGPEALGVNVVDDFTLVVTLEESLAAFPAFTSVNRLSPLPQHTIELHGEQWTNPDNIVTNGPYLLVSSNPNGTVLARNDGYPGPLPQIQRVVYSHFPSNDDAFRAYEQGELDALGTSYFIPPAEAARVLADPSMGALDYDLAATGLLIPNHRHPILGDVRVRRAFALAINRDELLEALLPPGFAVSAMSLGPPASWEVDPSLDPFAYDPELARQLLEDAGWVDTDGDGIRENVGGGILAESGQDLELTFTLSNSFNARLGGELQQHLSQVGISLVLNQMEPQAFEDWIDTSWELEGGLTAGAWYANYDDPWSWYWYWSSSADQDGFNTGWQGRFERFEEWQRLLRQSYAETDPALSAALFEQAEQVFDEWGQSLVEEVPAIPLFHPTGQTLARPWVHNFGPGPIWGLLPLETISVDSPLPLELQGAWEAFWASEASLPFTPPRMVYDGPGFEGLPVPGEDGPATYGDYAEYWLTTSGARIVIAPIDGRFSAYDPLTNQITITPEAVADIPAASAAVLFHQLQHAQQRVDGSDADCVESEVQALAWEAIAWDAMTGGGVPEPATPMQVRLNTVSQIYSSGGEQGLRDIVASSPVLQERCAPPPP